MNHQQAAVWRSIGKAVVFCKS